MGIPEDFGGGPHAADVLADGVARVVGGQDQTDQAPEALGDEVGDRVLDHR